MSASHKVVIYGHPASTCTQRVLLALAEKGVTDYELKIVDLSKGEHKQPEYLAKQPFGQIPVLEDGDYRVYESRAMTRYIDDIYTEGTTLVPKDAKSRGLVEQWISIEMSHNKPLESLVYELVFKGFYGLVTDKAAVVELEKKYREFLKAFNTALEGKKYLVGDSFTLAGTIHLVLTFRSGLDSLHSVLCWC